MGLKYDTLFGERDKVQEALDRLNEYYNETKGKGYYVAFSGGKDSVVLLDIVKRSKLPYKAYFNNTTVEAPEMYSFIRKYHPEVIWNRPKNNESMFKLIKKKGMPTRIRRFCCAFLKHNHGKNNVVVQGIRSAESFARTHREIFEEAMTNTKKDYDNGTEMYYLCPIIDWTVGDVWEYIKERNLPYCSLYDEGWERLGCVGCPMGKNQVKELDRWPRMAKAYRKALDIFWEHKGHELKRWSSSQEYWEWWIDKNHKHMNPNQQEIF